MKTAWPYENGFRLGRVAGEGGGQGPEGEELGDDAHNSTYKQQHMQSH